MPPSGPRILITGVDGFVGRWLVPALQERLPDAELVGTSTAPDAPQPGVRKIALDLLDPDAIEGVVGAERPDAVVHLAAISTVAAAHEDSIAAMNVNLLGTMRLAQAVLRHVPDARFVHVSSSDVYGRTFARRASPLDEDAPLAPLNAYAASKAAADLLIGQMSASEGLRALCLRPFNHTGPGQDARFVVPSFARQIARIEAGLQPPRITVGNLESRREFLDVRDVVRAYAQAVVTPVDVFDGRPINLASGAPTQIREVLDRLIEFSTATVDVVVDPDRFRSEAERFAGGDGARALHMLGWVPAIPLETTLHDVLNAERAALQRSG